MYDYLIVGAGLYGATVAREKADAGYSVLVIDKRTHVAGNVYTEKNMVSMSISMELISSIRMMNRYGIM